MNWRAGRIALPLRLEEMKQTVETQSRPEVEGHSALITLTFSRGKWTVARGDNLGRMELS